MIASKVINNNPANRAIEVKLETIHDKAIISIRDTGIGILEDEQKKVFDRFYRGSKTYDVFGSGLGLAISRSMINLHHGEIKVDSKVGKGSTFIISLPTAD